MSRQVTDIKADTVSATTVNSTSSFVLPTCYGNPTDLGLPAINGKMIVDTLYTNLWVAINGYWIVVYIDN